MKTLILSLLFLLALYGCDLTENSSDNINPTQKTVYSEEIEYSLHIRKNNYLLIDTLSISFRVKNNSSSNKEFNFSNIQQLGYQIIDQNNRTASYYPNIVAPALSHFSIGPGEMKVLNQNAVFKDNNGHYIIRGSYLLIVYLLDNNSPKIGLEISVN